MDTVPVMFFKIKEHSSKHRQPECCFEGHSIPELRNTSAEIFARGGRRGQSCMVALVPRHAASKSVLDPNESRGISELDLKYATSAPREKFRHPRRSTGRLREPKRGFQASHSKHRCLALSLSQNRISCLFDDRMKSVLSLSLSLSLSHSLSLPPSCRAFASMVFFGFSGEEAL